MIPSLSITYRAGIGCCPMHHFDRLMRRVLGRRSGLECLLEFVQRILKLCHCLSRLSVVFATARTLECRRLRFGHAAIDEELYARDVARLIGSEEGNGRGGRSHTCV